MDRCAFRLEWEASTTLGKLRPRVICDPKVAPTLGESQTEGAVKGGWGKGRSDLKAAWSRLLLEDRNFPVGRCNGTKCPSCLPPEIVGIRAL